MRLKQVLEPFTVDEFIKKVEEDPTWSYIGITCGTSHHFVNEDGRQRFVSEKRIKEQGRSIILSF